MQVFGHRPQGAEDLRQGGIHREGHKVGRAPWLPTLLLRSASVAAAGAAIAAATASSMLAGIMHTKQPTAAHPGEAASSALVAALHAVHRRRLKRAGMHLHGAGSSAQLRHRFACWVRHQSVCSARAAGRAAGGPPPCP